MRLNRDPGLMAALMAAGGVGKLADVLGLNVSTVSDWDEVPEDRVLDLERLLNVPRHVLRPDLYEGYTKVAE